MNREREYLIPNAGLHIPNPETPGKPLPPAGASVTVRGGSNDAYWRRRKRDKDVVVGQAPAAAPANPADPIASLLAGTVAQVKAGLPELSAQALASALAAEQAGAARQGVIAAIQAQIAGIPK